jgi:2-keto-4-pentenoate hydratase/2-oxohepta-3-ene-1,7-dioic acid hydratase in catechol pathway
VKYLRFSADGNAHWGILDGSEITSLDAPPYAAHRAAGPRYALAHVKPLAACTPSKIVCVGRNYVDHAKELAHDVPTKPLIFMKPPSSLLEPDGTIFYPPDVGRLDYEGEVGIVIGKRMRHLGPREPAAPYIFGFTCVNDVTGRDLQDKDGQWTRAKGFDTFCPAGPVIATGLDAANLSVETTLNGQPRQKGHVSQLIFSFDVVLRYISRFMTLEAGDLICTGTPAGVGPMQVGDVVEVTVDGVGTLRNTIGKEEGFT